MDKNLFGVNISYGLSNIGSSNVSKDLDYFAIKILDFKNNIKKGKFDIKELTEIRRDILRHSKDIRGFLEEIRKDFNKSTTH